MKALLICPDERTPVGFLAEHQPLAAVPVAGRPLITFWLEHLAAKGACEVTILATDRPEAIRKVVEDGRRWGLNVTVIPEIRELSVEEARAKYVLDDEGAFMPSPEDIRVVDQLPGAADIPLFTSYADWFRAVFQFLPRAVTDTRVGVHEVRPGVWVGMRTRVAPGARLIAPCWLGENVYVGPDSVIGPQAVLEDRVVVESSAEISRSIIGPETFVGELTEIRNSYARDNTLINCETGSGVTVPDKFLLCSLGKREVSSGAGNWLGRLAALIAAGFTFPVALLAILTARVQRQPVFLRRVAARPQLRRRMPQPDTVVYHELNGCSGWLRYWPQLWSIVRGDFAWVGNRPLQPAQVELLSNDFERLWLAAPIGLISLADAEGLAHAFTDDVRACASFYAVQANWRLDLSILTRTAVTSTRNFAASFLH